MNEGGDGIGRWALGETEMTNDQWPTKHQTTKPKAGSHWLVIGWSLAPWGLVGPWALGIRARGFRRQRILWR
jgi:hypothetical protein